MAAQTSPDLTDRLVSDAQRVFATTLAAWAQDLLTARRQGLLAMQWQREGDESDLDGRWSIAA